MKALSKYFDFMSVLKNLSLLFIFLIFNNLEGQVLPYSSSILVVSLILGGSIILCPILYICSFLILGEVGFLGGAGIFVVIIIPIIMIYKKFKINSQFEYLAYTIIAMLGFVFIGNSAYEIAIEKRILVVILSSFLTFIALIAGKSIKSKGLKFKLSFEEVFAISIMIAILGLGICNLISPFLWKGIAVFLLLLTCYVYKTGIGSIISSILGISLAIYYGDLNFISLFLLYGIFAESLMKLSRYASSLSIIAIDYLAQVVFQIYSAYSYIHLISILVSVILFCAIPTDLLRSIKDKLYSFREKQLVRQSINRNRSILSGKLYDLSGVFSEMADAFNLFKKQSISENGAKSFIEKEIISQICRDCDNYHKCKKQEKVIGSSLNRLIDIGFAKGKLSLIDFPAEFSSMCSHPNSILYGINKHLSDYRAKIIENANLETGRDLIASQAKGVSEILNGLALDCGTLLKFHNRLERKLCDQLFKSGFIVTEILLYGEEDRLCASLIIAMKEFSLDELQKVVSKTLGMNMMISEKAYISMDKLFISFKKANDYDAVFGLARATKDGSSLSGDTHSITRLSMDKFLVALSDGMGSGENARSISSASLSLIESFYKAGLNENLILTTVNRLLSINTEDSFTALDIIVIDLKNLSTDFIKYGSPYGFIINDNGIKIVEGNCLPLGIVDELSPSVANAFLDDGDIVLLLTDGISDAFSSSGALIEFLRTLTAKNPQTLSDQILKKAIELNDGQIKDDMTALAVRVYKKAN